jgi:hypothetical protein
VPLKYVPAAPDAVPGEFENVHWPAVENAPVCVLLPDVIALHAVAAVEVEVAT